MLIPPRGLRDCPLRLAADLPGPGQGPFDIGAQVPCSEMALEFRLLHEERRLLPGAAEEKRRASRAEEVREVLDRCEARRVDGGHVAKAEDHDRRGIG